MKHHSSIGDMEVSWTKYTTKSSNCEHFGIETYGFGDHPISETSKHIIQLFGM